MANSFSEGQCSCTTEKFRIKVVSWEGLAPARPQNFGTAGAVPSDFTPNEFGFQKTRHQPLAEASGMSSFRTLPQFVCCRL